MNQAADAKMAIGGAIEDFLNNGSIAEPHGCSCGICYQLLHKIARNLSLILEEEGFEFANVLECCAGWQCGAGAGGKFAARVNRLAFMENKLLAIFADAF